MDKELLLKELEISKADEEKDKELMNNGYNFEKGRIKANIEQGMIAFGVTSLIIFCYVYRILYRRYNLMFNTILSLINFIFTILMFLGAKETDDKYTAILCVTLGFLFLINMLIIGGLL